MTGATDWSQADQWDREHELIKAFARLRRKVADGKKWHGTSLPERLKPAQRQVLLACLGRLLEGDVRPTLSQDVETTFQSMARNGDGPSGSAWNALLPALGLSETFEVGQAMAEGRHYAIAQMLAMSPGYWSNPVQMILFSVVHYAIETALRRGSTKPEPLKTEAVLRFMQEAVEHHVIPAMDRSRAALPETHTLDFGTASMQEGRDLLAADLAVVAGVNILGRAMYRVVVFQAKRATVNGIAQVGQNEGRQLDTLVSTGMGWYLFYPEPTARRGFLATVRSATRVFQDVWSIERPPGFGMAKVFGEQAEPSWDFPSFVSMAMASETDLSIGRVFPDAAAAAAALSVDRKHPLAADLVAWDSTGRLRLHDFIDAAAALGYEQTSLAAFPSLRDPRHRPDPRRDDPDPFAAIR